MLRPSAQLTLAECCPPNLAEQVSFFHKNGFCVVEGVLEGAALAEAQAAYTAVMQPAWAEWEAERAKGVGFAGAAGGGFASGTTVARRYFSLGNLAEVDDCFVELMDHPKIVPLATHFAGGGDVDGNPGDGNELWHGIAQTQPCGGTVLPPDTDTRYSPRPLGYLGVSAASYRPIFRIAAHCGPILTAFPSYHDELLLTDKASTALYTP